MPSSIPIPCCASHGFIGFASMPQRIVENERRDTLNGMDAITGLNNHITSGIDPVDYMWFKNFSDNRYTLCYI